MNPGSRVPSQRGGFKGITITYRENCRELHPHFAVGAAVATISLTVAGASFAADITGAGSSFINPVLSKWAEGYKAATNNTINYQSVGSGAGIKQLQAKTVVFGATDKPMSDRSREERPCPVPDDLGRHRRHV